MCFVVIRYYDGICYSLRDEVILIIFDGKYNSEKASAIACINAKRCTRTESQFSLPDDDNNRQCA